MQKTIASIALGISTALLLLAATGPNAVRAQDDSLAGSFLSGEFLLLHFIYAALSWVKSHPLPRPSSVRSAHGNRSMQRGN